MRQAVLEQPVPQGPRIAPITVEQYHRMIKTGILMEGAPIELIDGMLVYKDRSARGEDPMSIGKLHNLMIKLLSELDPLLRPFGCHLQAQGPITLPPHHEPEPDGAIVRGLPRDYTKRLPNAADVSCVIEVADSSLDHDRTTKLKLYAQAGIPQYVLVNLADLQIEVYEQPLPAESRYAQGTVLKAGQTLLLALGAGKRLEVPAEKLLP